MEEIISTLSDSEQYAYGLKAGHILRKIHSIPAPDAQEDWESWLIARWTIKFKSIWSVLLNTKMDKLLLIT